MLTMSGFAQTAALIGDPARANMLAALMDGRALTATELAGAAHVLPQTASFHLARLTEAGLLAVERQGRHRYHRLASAEVARMLESIMAVSAGLRDAARPAPVVGPRDRAMRQARTCYDHLAGRLAVAIADRLTDCGHVELAPDGGRVTEGGAAFLRGIGVALDEPSLRTGRIACRPCLDWSERRLHIAGALGAALCRCCLDQGWVRRRPGTRALDITPAGHAAIHRDFGLRLDSA